MLILESGAAMALALRSSLDPKLSGLLAARKRQLLSDIPDAHDLGDLAHFLIVEPGDTVPLVEEAAAYPLFTDPAFEWAQDHGGWIEAVTILSDDGFGLALFAPTTQLIDPTILAMLTAQVACTSLAEKYHGGVAS